MALILASNWWALVVRGIAAIVFGIAALIFPPGAVAVFVLLFAAYAVVDGIFNLVAAFRGARQGERWGSLAFEGLVSLICGVLAFVWPGLTALAFVLLIAAWSVVTGVAELAAAIALRKQIEHEWLLGLLGALSIVFGILLVIAPGPGLVVIAIWIGAYALVFGALLVALGLKLRSWAKQLEQHGPAIPQHV